MNSKRNGTRLKEVKKVEPIRTTPERGDVGPAQSSSNGAAGDSFWKASAFLLLPVLGASLYYLGSRRWGIYSEVLGSDLLTPPQSDFVRLGFSSLFGELAILGILV